MRYLARRCTAFSRRAKAQRLFGKPCIISNNECGETCKKNFWIVATSVSAMRDGISGGSVQYVSGVFSADADSSGLFQYLDANASGNAGYHWRLLRDTSAGRPPGDGKFSAPTRVPSVGVGGGGVGCDTARRIAGHEAADGRSADYLWRHE